MKKVLLLLFTSICLISVVQAQYGKIKGYVVDQATNDPLIGANVMIDGTNIGAATNAEGFFVILNAPPGTVNLKASYMGYTSKTVGNVVVYIDQTTEINITLAEQSIETGTVYVVAAAVPRVQKDVASSRANISAAEMAQLPTVSVNRVLGLQAGVQSAADGISVRGGSVRETAYIVNGLSLRDERDNKPYTSISVTAIENAQVTTGGFSAEYGDLRSGLVNISTREGSRDQYSFKLITRTSPVTQKHFGISPHDKNSYWIRPFVDQDVAWTGTKNGKWNTFVQQQYQEFEGWNSISQKTLKNDNPNDDLTPEAAQRLFLWEHRKQLDIQNPDYDIDMSLSGPVPGGKSLGDLRFLASYRGNVNYYLVPLATDSYRDWSATLKLTADLAPGMKLMVDGLMGRSTGTNDNNAGESGIFMTSGGIAGSMNQVSYIDARLFTTDYWAPSTVNKNNIGLKLTHAVNATTFYEVVLSRFSSKYDTNPGRLRDTTKIMKIGNNYWVDEAPFGFQPAPSTGIGSGLRMGVGMSNSRDSSKIDVYQGKFDLVSQIDKYNQVKAGLQVTYTKNKTNYASVDTYLPAGRSKTIWDESPVRGALYLTDKLEFEGMIANIGVRLDYFNPRNEWYDFVKWTDAFKGENQFVMDTLLSKTPSEYQLNISPRIGIAFPITVESKIYFNYGHMRSFPTPENLYMLRRDSFDGKVLSVANPNSPLEKTIQYELGYEHSLFEDYLLRVAGYYKNVSLQRLTVRYVNRANDLNYTQSQPNSYQDIRGFEITLSKNRGQWFQGFINYTYDVRSSGRFGFAYEYQNPAIQREYERTTTENEQSKPRPTPFARASVSFLVPDDFGPKVGDYNLLGGWRINLLAEWSNGFYFTWAGGSSIPGLVYNAQWRDSWNADLRFSKAFQFGKALEMEFILDISNVFNFKQMSSSYGFYDGKDYNSYMKSLHLPGSIGDQLEKVYVNIPGEDKPGDYRLSGDFTPIVPVVNLTDVTKAENGAIYWEKKSFTYYEFNGTAWVKVDDSRMDTIIKNKQYIDMPNLTYYTFLNPRKIYFGLKLSVAL